MDAVKKLGKSTVKLPKNAYYKAYVNLKSTAVDIEKTANAFLHKGFNPDQVYKWLRLSDGNKVAERGLYDLYKPKYQHIHPGWRSKLKAD